MAAILSFARAVSAAQTDEAPKPPVMEYPRSVKQGSILVLKVRNEAEITSLTARLLKPSEGAEPKEIWISEGKPRMTASGERAMLAFLCVPLSVQAGEYVLSVSAVTGERPWEAEAPVTVEARKSPYMEIKLNEALTGIKASPDPRKAEESREISALLTGGDASADFIAGPFARPLAEKAVTATFGDARKYLYATGGSSTSVHLGLDLHHDTGVPVAASGRGRVVMAKERIVTGKTVVIEHEPGLFSLYYHMDRIDVAVGDFVEAGRTVGAVGSTGLATGPHLHWELRLRAEAVDPECLVGNPILEGLVNP